MFMRKKVIMKLLPIKIHSIKCPQDVTAPCPVHKKQLIIFLKNTGGIDIFTYCCCSSANDVHFHCKISFVFSLINTSFFPADSLSGFYVIRGLQVSVSLRSLQNECHWHSATSVERLTAYRYGNTHVRIITYILYRHNMSF